MCRARSKAQLLSPEKARRARTMSVFSGLGKRPQKLSEVPMHVLRIIGMRLRIRSRPQMDEAIPDRMLQILDDLDWKERFKHGRDDSTSTTD